MNLEKPKMMPEGLEPLFSIMDNQGQPHWIYCDTFAGSAVKAMCDRLNELELLFAQNEGEVH